MNSCKFISESELPTKFGDFTISAFEEPNGKDHLALTIGDVEQQDAVMCRVHSECLTGDALHSLRCDCGPQLQAALQMLAENKSGSSVNPAQGLTFPAVLRSMLRQDPDVILVGEIRDAETAELAMRAALTGHLVLSTLHTIDALSSISRLTDLGVSPTLIADAVRFVINQRLVRKLCQSCKAEVPEPELLENERLFRTLRPNSKSLFRSSGCEDCNGTGFRGRLPIAQIWELSEQSKRLLRAAVITVLSLPP